MLDGLGALSIHYSPSAVMACASRKAASMCTFGSIIDSMPPAITNVLAMRLLAGRANPFAAKQINPALAPPAVAPLYSAMTGTLNYKTQHGSGRAAHTAAGQANDDWPTASQANPPVPAGLTGRDLSESLRLSKKQRQHAEELAALRKWHVCRVE